MSLFRYKGRFFWELWISLLVVSALTGWLFFELSNPGGKTLFYARVVSKNWPNVKVKLMNGQEETWFAAVIFNDIKEKEIYNFFSRNGMLAYAAPPEPITIKLWQEYEK